MPWCFGTGTDGHFYWHTDRECPWPRQGKAIRRLRRTYGWSLRQAATALDVGIVRMSDLERGYASISAAERARLKRPEKTP